LTKKLKHGKSEKQKGKKKPIHPTSPLRNNSIRFPTQKELLQGKGKRKRRNTTTPSVKEALEGKQKDNNLSNPSPWFGQWPASKVPRGREGKGKEHTGRSRKKKGGALAEGEKTSLLTSLKRKIKQTNKCAEIHRCWGVILGDLGNRGKLGERTLLPERSWGVGFCHYTYWGPSRSKGTNPLFLSGENPSKRKEMEKNQGSTNG